jgi:pimeloyl-ACP methyl ester carboxylesterase
MYVSEHGSRGAESIIFLHGTAVGGWMWHSYLSELSDYHCLLPDLPGHGKSNDLEWNSLEDTAQQVIQVIRERAHRKRAHLVGSSLGGSVAFQVLCMSPEVVDYTLISGTSLLPMPGGALFKGMLHVMAPLIKTDFFINAALKALNFSTEDTGQFKEALQAVSGKTFVNAWSTSLDLRFSPALEKVKTPILLMAGEKEQAFIHRSNAMLAERLPDARARIAPGMGHGWMGESPELFKRVLKAWLKDKELPGELLLKKSV